MEPPVGDSLTWKLVALVLGMGWALVALARFVATQRAARGGKGKPEGANGTRAHVDPDDAPWFKDQQRRILRGVNRLCKRAGLEQEHEQ